MTDAVEPINAEPTNTATEPEPQLSLAEHEAEFGKPSRETPVGERVVESPAEPPAKPRQRAKSQQATKDDLDEIAKLTKELRETEKDIEIPQRDGESPRVYELRKRSEIAKLAKEKRTAPPAQDRREQAPVPRPQQQQIATAPASAFSEKEPTLNEFVGKSDDPYLALSRALGAYDRRKEAFDSQQETIKVSQEKAQRDHQQWVTDRNNDYVTRMDAYVKAHPDSAAVFKKAFDEEQSKPPTEQRLLTPVLYAAIHLSEKAPEFMLKLINDRELGDELFLLTEGRPLGNPLTNPLVATVQRRLLARMTAVTTGSASPRALHVAPRPPNPVRTVPQAPIDAPPAEGSSLAAHNAYYGTGRRR